MAARDGTADGGGPDGGGGRVDPSPEGVTGLSYAEASAELDAIIDEFDAGTVDVDRLVERLERATVIVDELDRRLRRTRMQVEELVPRLEALDREESAPGVAEEAGTGPA